MEQVFTAVVSCMLDRAVGMYSSGAKHTAFYFWW